MYASSMKFNTASVLLMAFANLSKILSAHCALRGLFLDVIADTTSKFMIHISVSSGNIVSRDSGISRYSGYVQLTVCLF